MFFAWVCSYRLQEFWIYCLSHIQIDTLQPSRMSGMSAFWKITRFAARYPFIMLQWLPKTQNSCYTFFIVERWRSRHIFDDDGTIEISELRSLQVLNKCPYAVDNQKYEGIATWFMNSTDTKSDSNYFAISSPVFRWYIWGALCFVLLADCITLFSIFYNYDQSYFWITLIGLMGFCMKLVTLWVLFSKKGPFEILVYIWGGMMIVSGFRGLYAYAVSVEAEPIDQYVNKALFVIFGLSLIIPLRYCVHRSASIDLRS